MSEPIESMAREAARPHTADMTYAANMSHALMHAMTCGIGGHGPAAPQHAPHVTGPAIRPIGEAFAMAFAGIHEYGNGQPVRMPDNYRKHALATIN